MIYSLLSFDFFMDFSCISVKPTIHMEGSKYQVNIALIIDSILIHFKFKGQHQCTGSSTWERIDRCMYQNEDWLRGHQGGSGRQRLPNHQDSQVPIKGPRERWTPRHWLLPQRLPPPRAGRSLQLRLRLLNQPPIQQERRGDGVVRRLRLIPVTMLEH
jgi:hypothetical protein